MKKKLWLHLLAVLLIVVLAAGLSVNAFAVDGEDEETGMNIHKQVDVQEDGTYIVDLEAFATGSVSFSNVSVPVDLILVLDVSGSMDEQFSAATYEYVARESQSYTYNSYGNNTYYYKIGDRYYQVSRGTSGNLWSTYYDLHFSVPSGYYSSTTYYLTGNGEYTQTQSNARVSSNTATIYTGVLYERVETPAVTKIDALKDAVNSFLGVIEEKNQEIIDLNTSAGITTTPDSELSRVAIVKFASETESNTVGNDRYYAGSDYWGDYYYNYTQTVYNMTVVRDADTQFTRVGQFVAGGATAAEKGLSRALGIYNTSSQQEGFTDRETVVVMFTDGAPTHGSSFDSGVANSAISNAKSLKDKGVKVYSVAVLSGADPSVAPGAGTNENTYLHAVSSNYPDATSMTSYGTRYTQITPDGTVTPDFYYSATSAGELEKIFTAIAQSSSGTSSQVGKESVMKDIVSSSFTLPNDANPDTISVSVVPWNSTTHDWSTTTSYTIEQWKTECLNYGAKAAENITVRLVDDDEDGTYETVDILGFDYSTHFQAAKTAADDHDGANAQTAKIVVHFPIAAKPAAVTGGNVATNGPMSGIYLKDGDEEPILKFDVPEVVFTPVTYVVDYVTSARNGDTKPSTVVLDYSGVLKNVEMLDDPEDEILQGKDAIGGTGSFEYRIYVGRFGTISFGDDYYDVQRRYVRYAPTTMNWSDYDRIFIKGASANPNEVKNVWAMLCVIPANNVYYEDTYLTSSTTVVYNEKPVTIEYTGINYSNYDPETGESTDWAKVGAEGSNNTYHAGDDMGWISGLADDTSYANGSAHVAGGEDAPKATANFTFTGTGVDIYSRTNGQTGVVSINVKSAKGDNESGKKVSKTQIIDTKAAAGDFFGIPVCSFMDLPYGKYTATITVTKNGAAEGRYIFYLDGVRVYNPIQPLTEAITGEDGKVTYVDENVHQMYGDKNMGAVFTTVRDLLGTGAEAAALYIDEHTVPDKPVPSEEDVADAKLALAAAQAAREEYIKTNIDPKADNLQKAKAALENAEFKMQSEKYILDFAAGQYADAIVSATVENSNYTELAAAVNAAKSAVPYDEAAYNSAVSAIIAEFEADEAYSGFRTDSEERKEWVKKTGNYDSAVTAYNEAASADFAGMQAALDAAIEGRADVDAGLQTAIEAYEAACNGAVDVQYSAESDLRYTEYNKEGPKTEVLLDEGQQVAINVESGKTYYVGLRSLYGQEIDVLINNKQVKNPVSHTIDLYYEATPASGQTSIVIKNNGGGILSVTKLRTTNGVSGTDNKSSGVMVVSAEETMAFVRSLAAMDVIPYTGEVMTEEEATAVVPVEEPIAEEPEVTEVELTADDIVIENSEADVPPVSANTSGRRTVSFNTMFDMISSFKGFFKQ